ncbi:uncharacterized protein LOC143017851 [Oratosquilla oratoria]|uniref:uncharacterized protein LOC143017851 n=1 Tax=Oratosquilla oratoria TaxID=337810 RepID=UPI003F76DA97
MSTEEAVAEEVVEKVEESAGSTEENSEESADEAKADEAKTPPKKRAKTSKGAGGKNKKEGGGKKRAPKRTHPKTLDMVTEAIENLGDSRGLSVQAIKAYILTHFKTVRTDMIRSMLRRALAAGLESGALVRPKGQLETQAMSGRYMISKKAKRTGDEANQTARVKSMNKAKLALAKKNAKKLKKKGRKGASPKKVAKRPVAKKVSRPPPKAAVKSPAKKSTGRRGRK